MGKFKNTVICSDVDGTLIDDNFKIPQKNLDAMKYFREMGGKFTLATGRTIAGLRLYIDQINPDLPIVCQNGSAIYDFEKGKYIWWMALDKSVVKVAKWVEENFPSAGIELMTVKDAYTIKENHATRKHENDELFKFTPACFETVKGDWLKMVFADSPPVVDKIQAALEKSPFADEFIMVRSYGTYYEVVAKGTDKGVAVDTLRKMYSIEYDNLYVAGDNHNDCKMLTLPCKSFAPSSAAQIAKDSADIVLKSSNNDGVIDEIIKHI